MIALARPLPADEPLAPGNGIPVWHIVISGFTQSLHQPTGCQYLWDAIRRARSGCPDAAALLEPWNADWAGVADLIFRFRPSDRPPRVYCYAYSWGGGWGFPSLARCLEARGLGIEHAVLCDAVYRSPYRALAWLALTRLPKIVAPPNVKEVDWFFQRSDRFPNPRGHEVIASPASETIVHAGVELDATHHWMDDQWAWRLKCLAVADNARPAPQFGSLLERLDAA